MERKPEMKKSLASLVLAALGVLLLTGTNVWADPIQWSFTSSPITKIDGTSYPGGSLPASTNSGQTSSIAFLPSSGNVTGSTGIIIYNMATQSVATSAAPDSFNNVDFLASFTVSDTKTNTISNPTGSALVSFHGKYNATNVTAGSLTKGKINWVNDVLGNLSATEASVVLGTGTDTRTYDFNIGDFLSSQAPNGGLGSFAVDATVTDGGALGAALGAGEVPPTDTPEPASLVLAGFGLPLVVLMRRRLKKTNSEATVA
jgi:hypothetical protein